MHTFHILIVSTVLLVGFNKVEGASICELCYGVANILLAQFRGGVSTDVIALEAAGVCTMFGIERGEVCRGIIDRNIPIFEYMVKQNKELGAERICDLILIKSGCDSTNFEWSVEIPEGETVPKKPQSNPASTFNVLQISDIHYDPQYTPGKQKSCSDPVCCQSDQPDGSVEDGTACGYWSEYFNVDASEALIDETIRKANELEFDYVYVTGDIIGHRIWSTSIEKNTKELKKIFKKLKDTFKDKPIYPILGNHEATPLNEYATAENLDPSLSTDWLYQVLFEEFSEWLPGSCKDDIMKGGFYSVSPKDGFRIIGLNSNVADTENWWLIHNDVDPFGQLSWLAQTLKEAEDNNEIVHILSHYPNGKNDLFNIWSREYYRIVERFANTIAAQFNGHTHHDQFMIYFSSKNTSEAINVAINGASVVSDKSNPTFKLITVDSSNYDIIDTDQWTFNLTEANLNPEKTPDWYKLYSFREHYGVKSLAPTDFTELIPRMAANHSLLYDYHIFRYRNSDLAIQWGCDNDCKRNYLCEISTSHVGNNTQCDRLIEIFNEHI